MPSVPSVLILLKQMSRYSELVNEFLLDPNTMKLRQTDRTSFHLAILRKRHRIVAIASNRLGTRSRGSGYSRYTIHAEKNVIKTLGDISKIKGCDLFVMNIKSTSLGKSFACSKPCHDCKKFLLKCQTEYGLKNVYYTSP